MEETMGNVFKHISDLDVVKRVFANVFSSIVESEEEVIDTTQAGKTIVIENTYELTPFHGTTKVPTIVGEREVSCVKWDVITFDHDAGVRYHKDGSGTPPTWDERELGTVLSLEEALLLILADWSRVTVGCTLENLSYEDDQIEEEKNPLERFIG
jgi:hypothetical protein